MIVADPRGVARERARLWALLVGFAAAALYYAPFLPLIFDDLTRLAEGAGPAGPSRPLLDRVWFELRWAQIRWGLPAALLAVWGLRHRARSFLERGVRAWWASGGLLALAALFTPLDVRYLFALTPALALTAGEGAYALLRAGGRLGLLGWLLLVAQSMVGLANLVEAVYSRYRS